MGDELDLGAIRERAAAWLRGVDDAGGDIWYAADDRAKLLAEVDRLRAGQAEFAHQAELLRRTQAELMKALETVAAGSALRQVFVDLATQVEAQLADLRHELDVLRGINVDLQQRLDLALGDCGHDLAVFADQRAELDAARKAADTHVAVPREQWVQVRAVVDAAKAWRAADDSVAEQSAGGTAGEALLVAELERVAALEAIAAAIDALDEDDPREEADGASDDPRV